MSATDLIEQARRYARHDDYQVTRDLITRLADEVERLMAPALAASGREQFEADYLAACPKHGAQAIAKYSVGKKVGRYVQQQTLVAFKIWQQQAARHAAEVAELVAALKDLSAAVNREDSMGIGVMLADDIAEIILEKYEVKKP